MDSSRRTFAKFAAAAPLVFAAASTKPLEQWPPGVKISDWSGKNTPAESTR